MGLPVEIVSPGAVRELIARHILRDEVDPSATSGGSSTAARRLGSVRLHPHQVSAMRRIGAALDEFGGALLCDEVGMGKTFVALATAKSFPHCIVVAPAVLRDMWSQQSKIAGVQIPFSSFEQLSRGRAPSDSFDFVVIDEAHHARNPATQRYRELSRMVMRSRVLLLSATPVHNSRRDLTALLALFLGSRSQSLSAAELGRCVIRREIKAAGLASQIPEADALTWMELADDDGRIPDMLMSLPPPLAVREGGIAGVLVSRSLVRQWCSSDAALESALLRRLGRSVALIAALESGHYPSEAELSAWTIIEDSIQLAFPSLVAAPTGETAGMLEAVRRHQAALREVLEALKRDGSRDEERSRLLIEIRRAHPAIPVVAFSQYSETVNAMFRELRREPGVAALTARGARVAGGSLTRREAISRFAPRASGARPASESERIDLLLTTDLLSEGVNLQDAGVVAHLDLPWTAARLEQRLGRVARLGSHRRRVYTYGIRPSDAGEMLIRMESTIRRKIDEAENATGRVRPLLPEQSPEETFRRTRVDATTDAPTSVTEHVREILKRWIAERPSAAESMSALKSSVIRVAAVGSKRNEFVALCSLHGKLVLLVSHTECITDNPVKLLEVMRHSEGFPVDPLGERIDGSIKSIEGYFRANRTVGLAAEIADVAHARRAALRRVSATIQRARPHARSRLLHLATAARFAILGRMSAAAESELIQSLSLEMPDEEWLSAVAGYDTSGQVDAGASESGDPGDHARIVALLLLQREL